MIRRMHSAVNSRTRRARAWFRRGVDRVYVWACERLYHELAWGYDAVAAAVSLGRWARWRRMALDAVVGRRVLELGFGTGALLVEGSRRFEMVGLDPSPEMQRVAGWRLAAHGLQGMRVAGYAQALPFADGSMDSVLATFPAAYILERATLAECARVLVPGGRLVIGGLWVSADLHGWERWIPVFFGAPPEKARAAWLARLREAGFAVQIIESRDGVFRVGIIMAQRERLAMPKESKNHAPRQ